MKPKLRLVRLLAISIFATVCSSSCVMQRTVSENGHVVSQDYVVERPIRDAILEGGD